MTLEEDWKKDINNMKAIREDIDYREKYYKEQDGRSGNEQLKIETETRKLIALQEREKARELRKTTKELEHLNIQEAKRLRREAYLNTPDGRVAQAHEELQAKYERDRASGMTPQQIAERDRLHQEYLKDGKASASEIYSGDPKITHKRYATNVR